MSEFNSDAYLDMQLLRFTTAGSVDDGKSTLIGRLLYDSKSIFEDQLEAVHRDSIRRGNETIDLALLTDGLRAEREQGITIDVAYRYFATPKRKFIIADTPGHIQYTRNMVTGASTANLALILIDARHGVLEQTIRHSFIATLLHIPHLVVCVNKMDLMDYDQITYENIKSDIYKIAGKLKIRDLRFIPISALKGDNVVNTSKNMDWYSGPPLLKLLEEIDITYDRNLDDPRFAVQYVIRPQIEEFHDYRGYAGRISGGWFRPGDQVTVLPSGLQSVVKTVDVFGNSLQGAKVTESVSIQLEDDIDISRGNMIVSRDKQPMVGQNIDLMICWFNEKPLKHGGKYAIKHTTRDVRCIIKEIDYKMDINTLEENTSDKEIKMNDIGRIRIKTTQPLYYDSYTKNRITGSLILIDEATNETVAAGMII